MARVSKKEQSIETNEAVGGKESTGFEMLQKIKTASKYKDFIFLSINDLLGDRINQKPTDIFEFPPYKEDLVDTKQKELFNDIDYDRDEFDKLKKMGLDVDIDIKTIEKNIDKEYPNQALTTEKPKYSVSEIKQHKHDNNQIIDNKTNIYQDAESDDETLMEDKTNDIVRMDGTEIGTLLHSFMEHYDFETEVKKFISDNENRFDKLSKYISYINNFLLSELGKAIEEAKKNNKLYREQRFMIELPLADIKQYMAKDEEDSIQDIGTNKNDNVGAKSTSPLVIIQGVIDAFYINDNGNIVLIDYKTDGLSSGKISREQFINNYKIQMDIYERALNQITGKKVEKKFIYSFALNEAISI